MTKSFERVGSRGVGRGGGRGVTGGAPDEGGEEGGGSGPSSSVTERSAPEVCLVEGPWALSISSSEEDYGYPVHHRTSAQTN